MSNPVVYPQGATSSPIQLANNAQGEQVFTFPAAPAGSTWYLNFVVCFNPAANTPVTAPMLPKVEFMHDIVGPVYQVVKPNIGFQPIDAGDGTVDVELVNHPSGFNGVYQLLFSPEAQYTLSGAPWKIRWTNNDPNAIQVTFVVDSADTVLPWIAFALGGATDFAQASTLTPLSDAPTPPWTTPVQLICGQTYDLTVPIYNFGCQPLSITIAAPITTGQFSVQPITTTIPPGGADKLMVQLAPQGNPGAINSFASPAVLTIPNADTIHPGTISFYATVGNMEIVFALDVSGSMATVDVAGGQSRWVQLTATMAYVMSHLQHFAAGGTWAALLYPSTQQGGGNTQNIQAPIGITNTSSIDLTNYTPTNGTPMGPAIYAAMGQPGGSPATDCGQFLDNDPSKPQNLAGFQYDHRWLVLLTDGWSNIGDDPATFQPKYYNDRKVKAITLGYGGPGQTNTATLSAIANNSGGQYFPSNPATTDPSQGLASAFFKAISAGLALNFATDPSAVLPAAQGAKQQHAVIMTEYDRKAGFVLTFLTEAEALFVSFTLITPTGTQITPETAAKFGISYAQAPLSKAYFVDFGGKFGRTLGGGGTWTIVVAFAPPAGVAAGLPDSFFRGIRYAYQTVVDSDLTLHLGSGGAEIHHAGEPITLSAALAVKGTPVQDASVKAQIIGSGQGFDNWLASQTVTDAEYKGALEALGSLHDIQAVFVKTFALSRKGIKFPGSGSTTLRTLEQNPRTGAYETTFSGTTLPGTYRFLVLATGFDDKGNLFQRQKTENVVIHVLPDEASTLIDLSYRVVGGQMQAVLRFWLYDAFANVYLIDPTITNIVQVLLKGGATAAGPLKGNLDGSYTQVFTYPLNATPIISIIVGGNQVVPSLIPPELGKLLFVDEVIDYKKGREAKPGANAHPDPAQALGDPSQRSQFFSTGGRGTATYAIKGTAIHARAVTVFVGTDIGLRSYKVDVLPDAPGATWIEIGRSAGVTQTFSLLPRPKCACADPRGSYIEIEGKVFGDTFEVKVPLESRLHEPPDPLLGLGKKRIRQVRITDVSNRVNPDDRPGLELWGTAFTPW